MCRLQTLLIVVLSWTIALASTPNHRVFAQFRSGSDAVEPVAESRPSDQPKAMIALSIWMLTVTESQEEADPELTARTAKQSENLSRAVGSVSEVRELVGGMRAAGRLSKERELRMLTLDGQHVTTQSGRNQPRITGVSTDPRRGRTSSLVMEPLGVKIEALPRIDSSGQIQVNLEIGESNIQKSADVVMSVQVEGGPVFADVVITREFNTTARLKSGSAVLLQSDASIGSDDPTDDKTELIILGAAVVDSPE